MTGCWLSARGQQADHVVAARYGQRVVERDHPTTMPAREAGRGNHALVAEGFATRISNGLYRLAVPPARDGIDMPAEEDDCSS